jgi:hypothetical protein
MKNKLFGVLPLVAVLSSGCGSLNNLMTSNTDPYTGAPSHFAEAKRGAPVPGDSSSNWSMAETIVKGTVKEVMARFNYEYQNLLPDAGFDATYTPTENGMEVVFKWDSPKGFFPLGEYNVLHTGGHNGRQAMVFAELVTAGLTEMRDSLDQVGMEYEIHATYYGQADGTPIRQDSGLVYRGEYGMIDLPEDVTTLNGVPHHFLIQPSQRLTNEELAAVRAYSLSDLVRRGFGHVEPVDHYSISVVPHRGRDHRYAKVFLELKEK